MGEVSSGRRLLPSGGQFGASLNTCEMKVRRGEHRNMIPTNSHAINKRTVTASIASRRHSHSHYSSG
jgi:hypothetical protein